ncbi:hypothetical protein SASPL_126789 [Salvia splendens]|uniref:Uncharacterized protein n=1 Tax=Salvia splendens TaxID=180675 RepID=A0A8X8ZR49_SALSN|nr:hypothetical protein SASPL_126789 [Salvia splendens]
MCRCCDSCGRVLLEDTYEDGIKMRIDDWYATLSNIVIDESESDSDGSSSSSLSTSSVEQRIPEIEPSLIINKAIACDAEIIVYWIRIVLVYLTDLLLWIPQKDFKFCFYRLSNIVIDESDSDLDGSSSSSNSSVKQRIVENEPTLSTLKQK